MRRCRLGGCRRLAHGRRLPAAAAARRTASAHAWRSAESGRRGLRVAALRLARGCDVLPRDDYVAFVQVAFDDFGRSAVGQTDLDATRLRLAVGAEHPDAPRLARQ